MAPFTCIAARETRATQIWARVTTRAAVGNCRRQILLPGISARRGQGAAATPPAPSLRGPPAFPRWQTATGWAPRARSMAIGNAAPGTRASPPGLGVEPAMRRCGPRRKACRHGRGWRLGGTREQQVGATRPRRSGGGRELFVYRPVLPKLRGIFRRPGGARAVRRTQRPLVCVGAVITRRHVGDLLAIVARVKPIAVIAGVESRRAHLAGPGA
jgi:hypothetical protein